MNGWAPVWQDPCQKNLEINPPKKIIKYTFIIQGDSEKLFNNFQEHQEYKTNH